MTIAQQRNVIASITQKVFHDDEELFKLNGGAGGAYDQSKMHDGAVIDNFRKYHQDLGRKLGDQAEEIKGQMRKDYAKEINSLKARALDGKTGSSVNLKDLSADNLPPSQLDDPQRNYMPSEEELVHKLEPYMQR